jgi:hypothetical protein
MKYCISLVFALICSFTLIAQNDYDDLEFKSFKEKEKREFKETKTAYKFSLLFPSAGVECRLAKKFSFETAVKFNALVGNKGTSTSPKLVFFPFPVVHLEPKWNYNILKREKKGKNIQFFSSNFLSLYASYRVKVSPYTFHSFIIGPSWGLQRKLGEFGFFKLNTGLAYQHYFDKRLIGQYLPIFPIVDVQLGFVF